MREFFKSDKFVLLLLTAVFCALIPVFYLHQGLLSIDTGREFYIPDRLAQGDVLYKDIFNIYGALPYMLNSFLFKVFGVSIKTLYVAGLTVSWCIIALIYLISREFLPKKTSFLVGLTTITSLTFGVFLYNSVIPYAYAIVYALVFFLASVYLLVKHVKTGNKAFAYCACIAAGASFACKYEFLPYVLVLAYVLKDFDRKSAARCLCYTIFLPALFFFILLMQGVTLAELKTSAVYLNKMLHAPSMTVFCKNFGIYPSIKGIINLILQNKIFAIFAFLPVLNLVLFFRDIKNIVKDKALLVFLLCTFAACTKSFFYLNVNHYGLFVLPICLIASAVLVEKYSKRLPVLALAVSIFIFGAYNSDLLKSKTYLLETKRGNIYTFERDGKPIKTAVEYIEANTGRDDTVLVLPEGSIINFLTGRKTMKFYHSLIPLYYDDVFGEEKVTSDFAKNEPEIVVVLKQNTVEYGKKYIGKDYGEKLFELINKDYAEQYSDEYLTIFRKN